MPDPRCFVEMLIGHAWTRLSDMCIDEPLALKIQRSLEYRSGEAARVVRCPAAGICRRFACA